MKLEKALLNKPEVLAIEVTNRCNLNCVYCTKKIANMEDVDIKENILEKIRSNMSSIKKVIICGIGESFLYPDLYSFIEELPEQKICIVTNGTIPIDYKDLNKKHNVEQLIFSIDALDKAVLDKISTHYKFENVIKNLEAYLEYYSETKVKIARVLNCTINEHNIHELQKLIDFAAKYKFDTIHFSLPRGRESFIESVREELSEILADAKKKALKYGIFYANPFETCCVYLKWVTPYIALNGDVFACSEALYKNDVIGNIQNNTLEEIWNTQQYKEFQQGVKCEDCKFLSNSKFRFS